MLSCLPSCLASPKRLISWRMAQAPLSQMTGTPHRHVLVHEGELQSKDAWALLAGPDMMVACYLHVL